MMNLYYWLTTALVSGFLLLSSGTYFFHKTTIDGVKALGFPQFFIVQLAVLKIFAALILLIPNIPMALKEWAYCGTMLFFLTALVAHISHKDSVGISVMLVILMGILSVSYVLLKKM